MSKRMGRIGQYVIFGWMTLVIVDIDETAGTCLMRDDAGKLYTAGAFGSKVLRLA